MKKRLLAIVLAVVMLAGVLSVGLTAMAEEPVAEAYIGDECVATLTASELAYAYQSKICVNYDKVVLTKDVQSVDLGTNYEQQPVYFTFDLNGHNIGNFEIGTNDSGKGFFVTVLDSIGTATVSNIKGNGTSVDIYIYGGVYKNIGTDSSTANFKLYGGTFDCDVGDVATDVFNIYGGKYNGEICESWLAAWVGDYVAIYGGAFVNEPDDKYLISDVMKASINVDVDGKVYTCIIGKNVVTADGKVTAGTFTFDPAEFVANGYAAKDNGDGTWTVEVAAANNVAKIGTTEYETLAEALKASATGDEIILLADLADIGTVSLKEGVTLNGNGKTISGASSVYVNKNGGTVKNVNFKDIYSSEYTISAIYASNLEGKAVITGCTFENIQYEAIQITPVPEVDGIEIDISDNIFKHTGEIGQKRYIHIQYVLPEGEPGIFVPAFADAKLNITDNQMFDINTLDDIAISIDRINKASGSKLNGNYLSDRTSIYVGFGNIAIADYYPMRSQAEVDVDDIEYGGAAKIGSAIYSTLAEAIAAANAAASAPTVTLIENVVVTETLTINNANGKLITISLNGKKLTAKTTAFLVKSNLAYGGSYGGYTVLPDEAPFLIHENGSLVFYGKYSSEAIGDYINHRKYMVAASGEWFEVKNLSDADALACGYKVKISNEYYEKIQDAYAVKSSVTFIDDVTEDVASTNTAYLAINQNGHKFTGKLLVPNATYVTVYGGDTVITEINAKKLNVTNAASNITIQGGTLCELYKTNGTLVIEGGTFGFNPKDYVNEDKFEIIDNGDGTWTVQKKTVIKPEVKENYDIKVDDGEHEIAPTGNEKEAAEQKVEKTLENKAVLLTEEQTGLNNVNIENTESKEIIIKLTGVAVKTEDKGENIEATITKMKFDVTPTVKVNGEEPRPLTKAEIPATGLKFRLSVDESVALGTVAKVFHEGVQLDKEYVVKGDENGKYIEVIGHEFSEYSYELELDNIRKQGKIYGTSLLLKDSVYIRYYFAVDADEVKNYTVSYTFKGDEHKDITLSNQKDGYYVIEIPVYVKEFTEEVDLTLTDITGAFEADSLKYSVRQYCVNKLDTKEGTDNANLRKLCCALLDYGTYMQLYKGYNLDKLANADNIDGYTATELTAIPDGGYENSVTGATDGISVYGNSLSLEDTIKVRFYFELGEGANIADYTFTYKGESLTAVKNNDYYYVAVSGLAAKDLESYETVTVTKGGEGDLTVKYSPMAYAYNKQNSTKAHLADLVKAEYQYCLAAKAYFSENNG